MAGKGKAFERRIRMSLEALHGFACRVEDGGSVAKNPQTADFFYGPADRPGWYAIECKHTEGKSFELRKIGYSDPHGQLARLTRFECPAAERYAYIALEMREGCYLVPVGDFNRIAAACIANGRVSVPEAALQAHRVERVAGLYRLEFR